MKREEAIQTARDHVIEKAVNIDETNIRALRMPATECAGIFPFRGDVWIVHLPLIENDDVIASVNEIIVMISDSSGEACTIRGL